VTAKRSLISRALGRARRTLLPSTHERSHRRWVEDRGDETLRFDYALPAGTVVLDVGGFHGDWAAGIASRFDVSLHVFEPVAEFAALIRERLAGHPRLFIHAYGLAGRTREESFTIAGDGSSALRAGGERRVSLLAAGEAFSDLGLERVELMKVNIEGGEYELLEHLIERGLVASIANLQVQFHDFVPGAERRMREIQSRLAATHEIAWQYPFVWESWRRRAVPASPAASA
jgi:FkbM family methyltransferase